MLSSIKFRLLWSVIFTLLVALVLNSLLAHFVARHEVDEVFDAELLTIARIIKGVIDTPELKTNARQIGQGMEETLRDAEVMPAELAIYEKKILLQVWSRENSDLLFHSSNAPDYALAPLHKGFYYHDSNNQEWIVYVTDLPHADAWLLVGEIPQARNELSRSLIAVFIVSGMLAMLMAGMMSMSAIDFGLSSLEYLRTLIRHRSADNLEPIRIDPMPNELEPVVSGMNQMFGRIKHGMDAEKRFVADAAHELRTPLAVMKLRTQQLLLSNHDDALNTQLHDLEASVSRSHRVVEQLLLLARLDHQVAEDIARSCDIAEQARRTLAEVWPTADARGTTLELQAGDALPDLCFNPTLLDIALRNLLENAIRYSPAGSLVSVSIFRDHGITLSVCDNGPGVSEDVLPMLQERFYRAQGQEVPGAGLGLSIVARVCQHMHAALDIKNRPEGGLRVSICFPLDVNGREADPA